MTLLNDAEQFELHQQQMVTLFRLKGATSLHSHACGCSLCVQKRELARILEEPSDAEKYSILVEKIGRRTSGIGGGV